MTRSITTASRFQMRRRSGARDLGEGNNRDIVHYYAMHQPNRVFYIYDLIVARQGLIP